MEQEFLAAGIILMLLGGALLPGIIVVAGKTSDDTMPGAKASSLTTSNRSVVPKHFLLYLFFAVVYGARSIRGDFFLNIAYDPGHGKYGIKHPLMFLRGVWLISTLDYWEAFWWHLSESRGWGWDWAPFIQPHEQ